MFLCLFHRLRRKVRNSTKVLCASPSWSEYLYDIESGGIRTEGENKNTDLMHMLKNAYLISTQSNDVAEG